eukprot:COSAG02_NODE_28283_length_592_cov_1.040568_1_plen_175_part_01
MGLHCALPLVLLLLSVSARAARGGPKQCKYGTPNDGCPKGQRCSSGVCVPISEAPAPLAVEKLLAVEGGTVLTSAGRYTNVKLGVDGLPLIVYNRDDRGLVRAQHCGDAACGRLTAANISDQTLSWQNAGRFIDLVMGHDGLPLAVWAGPYIHAGFCSTPTCSSSSTTIIHQAKG